MKESADHSCAALDMGHSGQRLQAQNLLIALFACHIHITPRIAEISPPPKKPVMHLLALSSSFHIDRMP